MRGFHRSKLGSMVMVSADGQTATRAKGTAGDSECLLISDGPLEAQAGGGVAFGVRVAAVRGGSEEGLALGVTPRAPSEFPALPATADHVEPCWLLGCDGAAWDGSTKQWVLSDFNPRDLKVGDEVVLSVTPQGDLQAAVNGVQRASHALRVPLHARLFALVDLLGNTAGVSLLSPDQVAAARQKALAALPAVPAHALAGWRLGKALQFSEDGRAAARVPGAAGEGSDCLLLGSNPLERRGDGSAAFAFSIAALAEGPGEGLGVGVTARPPAELAELPASAHELNPSWLLGYDGAAWDGASASWGIGAWEPGGLAAGDRLEVRVSPEGQLRVAVNGALQASHDFQIPRTAPLFPVLELLGSVQAVSLPSIGGEGSQEKDPAPGAKSKTKGRKPAKDGERAAWTADGQSIPKGDGKAVKKKRKEEEGVEREKKAKKEEKDEKERKVKKEERDERERKEKRDDKERKEKKERRPEKLEKPEKPERLEKPERPERPEKDRRERKEKKEKKEGREGKEARALPSAASSSWDGSRLARS